MSLSLDARYAVRLIRRTPLVSTIIMVTLALCIGANIAIFSVVDAVLLRPPHCSAPACSCPHYGHVRNHSGPTPAVQGT